MAMQVLVRCGGTTVPLLADPGQTFGELTPAISERLAMELARHDVWYQHCGRRCDDAQTLAGAGLREGGTLQAHLRMRGGGGDGGATGAESRSSYLEMYMEKKPDKVDPAEERLARATTCKLTNERLTPPCVVDELGSLYNKEALVAALVSKSLPKSLGHISSLKHVTDAQLTPLPEADANGSGAAFCCPISGQPLNGQYRFCALLPSGHIISEKALKQVPVAVEEHVGAKWTESIPINGTTEELEGLWEALIARRAAARKAKKEKKGVKAEAVSNGGNGKRATQEQPEAGQGKEAKRAVQKFGVDERAVKKVKAVDLAPAHADKKIWASLFTSSQPRAAAETYACRSTSARGWM